MDVWEGARRTIIGARIARIRGEGDALDGHSLYTREKVAGAIALLDGNSGIGEEDWQLAGHLMVVSDQTRATVAAALRLAGEQRNEAQGRAEARRAQIVTDAAAQKHPAQHREPHHDDRPPSRRVDCSCRFAAPA
jgi:hypothetical protein